MQKYYGTRIADLLPRINHDILIPGIQRPYVWEAEQIVKLFDSLLRGYPINTFLFWEVQAANLGELDVYRFVRDFRQGDIHNDAFSATTDAPLTLVLDGQQRLTSLLIGLTGSYTVRNGARGRAAAWVAKVLMLDLLQAPDSADDDEDFTTLRELYYGFKFFAADRLPKNDSQSVWFKVSQIMQIRDRDQLGASIDRLLLLNPDLPAAAQQTLRDNLGRLWQVVHEEETLAYYLERDPSYDKVLDIFIRANDGGTKLSKSDLLMSMVTLRWDQFNARSETEAITYAMRAALEHDNAFDRDYLLRSGLFFNDLDFAFQLRNFTPRNIAVIEAQWEGVKRALLMATDLFARYGVKGGALTGVNAVMLIACYLFKANVGVPVADWRIPDGDENRIRRWIVSVLFHGVLGGAANVTMELYRRALNEQLKLALRFPVANLAARMTTRGRAMDYSDEAVGRFAAQEVVGRSRIATVCLTLLYPRDDWSAKDWQVVAVMPSHRLLDDRLRVQGVAAEEVPVYQSWSGRLANQMLLSDDEARVYFSMDIEDWARTRSPDFWHRHCLPDDPALYEEFSFLDFIQARKALIKARLAEVLRDDPVQPLPQSAEPAVSTPV